MRLKPADDTIAAIITPAGSGGVGVLRISGGESKRIFGAIWKGRDLKDFEPRKLYRGNIVDADGSIVDDVLAAWFEEGHSYTGEDSIEIFAHGGEVILNEILSLIIKNNVRPAEPGEFTKRAFLNGRMDLSQAEGVADLINASSIEGMKMASRQLKGDLSKHVENIKNEIIDLRSLVEASLDFSDDDLPDVLPSDLTNRLHNLSFKLEQLLSTYDSGRLMKNGIHVAIIGAPNVGKSSLFNALIGDDCAIVHHRAGTTRDILKESISIDGMTFFLHDTAGLRESTDEIERMGIDRAKELLNSSDLVLFVLDASRDFNDDDKALFSLVNLKEKSIVVVNKIDKGRLPPEADPPLAEGAVEELKTLPPQPLLTKEGEKKRNWRWTSNPIYISAKVGAGIDELKKAMKQLMAPSRFCEDVAITSTRHKSAVEAGLNELKSAMDAFDNKSEFDIIAHHLRMAQDKLCEITGEIVDEDVLNNIFSQFCIGK